MTKTEFHCDHCGKWVSVDYMQCVGLRETLPFFMDFAICERCDAKSQTQDEGGVYLLDDDYWIEWIASKKQLPIDVVEKMYELMQANREYDDLINLERRNLLAAQAQVAEWERIGEELVLAFGMRRVNGEVTYSCPPDFRWDAFDHMAMLLKNRQR